MNSKGHTRVMSSGDSVRVFQKEHAPSHQATCTCTSVKEQDFDLFDWLAKSLDLGPLDFWFSGAFERC